MEDRILTLAETAQYLKVAEKTLQRMIKDKRIPCTRVGNQWRFMKDVLDQWLIEGMNRDSSSRSTMELLERGEVELQLSRLLIDVVSPLAGGTKREILEQLIAPLKEKTLLDSPVDYLEMLLKREAMVSTAIGGGLALPHIRRPQDQNSPSPGVVIGLSPQGLDYDALDGEKVHVFFLIFCSSEVVHLRLLSKITGLFQSEIPMEQWLNCKDRRDVEKFLVELESRRLGGIL